QEDPIGYAGGINLYGFAGGDPVNFSDPFGLCASAADSVQVNVTVQCADGSLEQRTVWAQEVTDNHAKGRLIAGVSSLSMSGSAEDATSLTAIHDAVIEVVLFGKLYQMPSQVGGLPVVTAGGVPVGNSSAMLFREDVWNNIRGGNFSRSLPGRPKLQTCQIIGHEGYHLVLNARGVGSSGHPEPVNDFETPSRLSLLSNSTRDHGASDGRAAG
ncbi:MAG TPA: hypothetical protein VMO26_03425, partial [Vicinamibacterales bacterium]|nr:hypothetical protein [Vicinamibacterales bacterium]